MSAAKNSLVIFLVSSLVLGVVLKVSDARPHGRKFLRLNFYRRSCPEVEEIVRNITRSRVQDSPGLAAKLLRTHYHDCFVRGCDASILLDTVGDTPSEKDARPNLSLKGFDVIDAIKDKIEEICPGIVSCADILALAARDAVTFPREKNLWDVPTGRRDGTVSLASEVTGNLPSPFSNFSALMEIFTKKELDVNDLVILSGAHTIGVAHCGVFSSRLFNFTGNGDADPSLDPKYADFLRSMCPIQPDPATTVEMDPQSSLSFDSNYYTTVLTNKGLFQSDAALLTDATAAGTVRKFQTKPYLFLSAFSDAMQNMGAMDVLLGNAGEIRNNCRVVNPQ